MKLRSILFVPGDSEKKIAGASACGADALIFDLEDSVAPGAKPAARRLVRERLQARRADDPHLWVRINALDTEDALQDLAIIVAARPDVVILPKANSAADVARLDAHVAALEVRDGLPRGGIKVVAVATETPAAMFALGSYGKTTPRLAGLTWGAEDLAASIGATANRDETGLTPLFALARSLCLAAAAAADVVAIDTACMEIRNIALLERDCAAARRDGFKSKLAIHPNQVAVINRMFAPDPAEIARARAIIAAYERDPGLGTFQLDGQMIDLPHFRQAQKILANVD